MGSPTPFAPGPCQHPEMSPRLGLSDPAKVAARASQPGVGLHAAKPPLRPLRGLSRVPKPFSHADHPSSPKLHGVLFVLEREEQKQEVLIWIPSMGPLSHST